MARAAQNPPAASMRLRTNRRSRRLIEENLIPRRTPSSSVVRVHITSPSALNSLNSSPIDVPRSTCCPARTRTPVSGMFTETAGERTDDPSMVRSTDSLTLARGARFIGSTTYQFGGASSDRESYPKAPRWTTGSVPLSSRGMVSPHSLFGSPIWPAMVSVKPSVSRWDDGGQSSLE